MAEREPTPRELEELENAMEKGGIDGALAHLDKEDPTWPEDPEN